MCCTGMACGVIPCIRINSWCYPTKRESFQSKSNEGSTKVPNKEPQEESKKEEESKESHDSNEPYVQESKKEEPIAKVVYFHPHHLEK